MLPVQHSSWFCMFLQPLDSFTCVLLCGYVLCACFRACTLCARLWASQTPCTPHEILKSEDGDVCALRLARDVSWSSAGQCAVVMVVWPTHSLLPCSPPYPPTNISPCFPTEQMTFMPETISPLDCREYSLVVPRGPESSALLLFNNSDFIGFHSWVDTDVLVSAIMGPLSFHANWSEKAELRGCRHMQKENL